MMQIHMGCSVESLGMFKDYKINEFYSILELRNHSWCVPAVRHSIKLRLMLIYFKNSWKWGRVISVNLIKLLTSSYYQNLEIDDAKVCHLKHSFFHYLETAHKLSKE